MIKFKNFLFLVLFSLINVNANAATAATVRYVETASDSISMDESEIEKAIECLKLHDTESALESFDKLQIWNHKKLKKWVARSDKRLDVDLGKLIERDKKGKKSTLKNNKDLKQSGLLPISSEVLACLDSLTQMIFMDSIENTYCLEFVKTETGIDVKRWPIKEVDSVNYLNIRFKVLWVVE